MNTFSHPLQPCPDSLELGHREAEIIQDLLPELADQEAFQVLWRRVKALWLATHSRILASEASTEPLNVLRGRLAALDEVLRLPEELLEEADNLTKEQDQT